MRPPPRSAAVRIQVRGVWPGGMKGYGNRTQQRLIERAATFPFLQFLNSHKTGPVQPDFVARASPLSISIPIGQHPIITKAVVSPAIAVSA